METFRYPDPADRQWAVPLLSAEGEMGCEYNFNNIYLWSRAYPQKIARHENRLLVQLQGKLGISYLYPPGTGPLAPALEALEKDAAAHNVPLTLVCVTQPQRERLEQAFPGRFCWQEDRDGWDYLYEVQRLAELGGKKLHAKRNHIHRFDERFPDWMFEPITPDNIPECLELDRIWSTRRQQVASTGAHTLSEETIAVTEALYQMSPLALDGGLIRAGGRPVAFSLGSLTTPACFNIHFEKADGEIQGAYAVINREMARMVRRRYPQVQWLNREDDLGLEGLRRSKLSYYPEILLEKFIARQR